MKYRLGLDLGTNSIGAVALSLDYDAADKRYLPRDVIWHRAHIFSEPLSNTTAGLVPKTAERRKARLRRRQLQRRARRLTKLHTLAPLLGLSIEKAAQHGRQKYDGHIRLEDGAKVPYSAYVRAQAATDEVALGDLLHIFGRLAKRRGYSGGFKARSNKSAKGRGAKTDSQKQAKKGTVEQGAAALAEKLDGRTLGQYLLARLQDGQPTRLKLEHYNDMDLYALRRHVEDEFETIWATQRRFHKILDGEAACPIPGQHEGQQLPLKAIFKYAIFYQRPLKPFNALIGQCELEPNLPRSPKAQPAAQAFRIEKTLADLRIGQGRSARPLGPEQRDVIRALLNQQAELTLERIYKALDKADCPLPEGKRFSIQTARREALKGNSTLAGFRILGLLDDWQALDAHTQIQLINFLAELGSPEQLYDERWQEKFLTWNKKPEKRKQPTFSDAFISFIDKLRANEKFDRLAKMPHFEGGRSAYSIKALKRLTGYMREHHCDEHGARHGDAETGLEGCYAAPGRAEKSDDTLIRQPPKTGNAVVDVALRQLRHVLQDCVDALGAKPAEIIIELSREIKNSVTMRNEIDTQNRQREEARKKAAEDITKRDEVATPTNILKYELWEEQDHHCPYCNERIACSAVFAGSQTNFEHIIPRSQSSVGRKRSEIILAHRGCNAMKGKRLPLCVPEFINDAQRKRAIEAMAERLEEKGKKLLQRARALSSQNEGGFLDKRSKGLGLLRKAKLLRLDDDEGLLDESSGFADWQQHDTAWIAKLAAQWLRAYVDDMSITKGGLTAYMRRHLGLDTVIPELRYAEGKSVKTQDGNELPQADFERYKNFYEGHRWQGAPEDLPPPLDKRIDHRHHLVDALLIALSDRKIVIRATRLHQHYFDQALARTGKPDRKTVSDQMRKAIGRSVQAFKAREKAVGFLSAAHITHRPDHYGAGQFYQDGAYQKVADEAGKPRLVIRKTLAKLADKGNAEQVLKRLARIVSKRTREHVIAVFKQRLAADRNLSPKQALAKPIMQDWYGEAKPIFSVKVYHDQGEEKAEAISVDGKEIKYLIPGPFAYFKLVFTEDGQVDEGSSRLVTLAEHNRDMAGAPKNANRPSVNEWRYYKGDIVVSLDTRERFIVCKFKSKSKIHLAPLTETRNWEDIKEKAQVKDSTGTPKRDSKGKIKLKPIAFVVSSIRKIADYKPEYLLTGAD